MPVFEVKLDVSGFEGLANDLRLRLNAEAQRAAQTLGPAAHAHMLELANDRLNSRRQIFVDALSFRQEDANTFLVVLDAKARWIDDGFPGPKDMKPDLLGSSKAKTAKDGSRYLVVPFNHGPGKGPTNSTPAQQDLTNTLKAHFKARKIPWAKVEKGPGGQPLTGLLHSFDVMGEPKKTHNGPGQGHGAIGDVRQGPTGIPFLQGVRVHQRPNKDGKVKRTITTFRVVSSKMGNDRWIHPGLKPVRIVEDTYDWVLKEWEENMLPKILDSVLELGLLA